MIKGIGPVMAERMVTHFGTGILAIIETEPGRLIEVHGLGPKRAKKIAEAWTAAASTLSSSVGSKARWRLAARRPIGQFCAHQGWLHRVPVAAPNGGDARALPCDCR